MTSSARDAGLVRAVGPWALAASIVNIVVGAGIFAVPGALAASIGAYGPLAYVVCAFAVGAVAICFAEGGSRVPTSGGAYGYIESAFGPLAGFVAGMFLWISDVLACGGIAAAVADMAVGVLPALAPVAAHGTVVVLVIGAITLVNLSGVRHAARFVNAATLVKLVPLVVFLVAGAASFHPSSYERLAPPTTVGLGRALLLALFAFMGMETPLSASGEVAAPARTIPRALAMAMPAVTLLYVAIQVVAFGVLGGALAGSTSPLADAMGQIGGAGSAVGHGLRVLMLTGVALSMLGWIGSNILGSPRILFAFGRDGLLPGALGRLHPRTHVPVVAILVHVVIVLALALTGTFTELAVLSTLATSSLYVAGCASAWRLSRRGTALAGRPLGFRWLGLAATVGIASMLAIVALAARAEIFGLMGLTLGSAAIYFVRARRRSLARHQA